MTGYPIKAVFPTRIRYWYSPSSLGGSLENRRQSSSPAMRAPKAQAAISNNCALVQKASREKALSMEYRIMAGRVAWMTKSLALW